MAKAKKIRCNWAESHPLLIEYHDAEWGVPIHDDRMLFEKLILDGMQAGLSWLTILKKRDNFREAFDEFDPEKMARYTKKKQNALMKNEGIIRNRLKIESATTNARAYLELMEKDDGFAPYLWSFVGGAPIVNKWKTMKQLPAETPVAKEMSKALKKRGFRFVGPTICYAFMQAAGLVNDHLVSCFRYKNVAKAK